MGTWLLGSVNPHFSNWETKLLTFHPSFFLFSPHPPFPLNSLVLPQWSTESHKKRKEKLKAWSSESIKKLPHLNRLFQSMYCNWSGNVHKPSLQSQLPIFALFRYSILRLTLFLSLQSIQSGQNNLNIDISSTSWNLTSSSKCHATQVVIRRTNQRFLRSCFPPQYFSVENVHGIEPKWKLRQAGARFIKCAQSRTGSIRKHPVN
jgi:hypothetical protein